MTNQFFSCDWGTSSFRLRLIDLSSAQILAESTAGEGIAAVYALYKEKAGTGKDRSSFYLPVIKKHIKAIEQSTGLPTSGIPVMLSGMASSAIGMLELPYARLPFSLNGKGLQYKKIERTKEFAHDLVIISGACTNHDVMRGEETQLIGCAGQAIVAHQTFIFTGTHSKHITVSGGKATDIATYMTGEFFELLTTKSILSGSISAGGVIDQPENKQAFEQGVKDSLLTNLLHNSFRVRTNQLLKQLPAAANYFYLSGLLIGTELSQLAKEETQAIMMVGEKKLLLHYQLAWKTLGNTCPVTTLEAALATIQGQLVLYKRIYGVRGSGR
ncbi:MAG: 2-dehydro-3-deoxygalactonokinase [Bacteroidota bacterium]